MKNSDIENYIIADHGNEMLEKLWEQLLMFEFPLLENLTVQIGGYHLIASYTDNNYQPSQITQFIEDTQKAYK